MGNRGALVGMALMAVAVSVSGASDVVVEGNVITGNHEAEPVRVE